MKQFSVPSPIVIPVISLQLVKVIIFVFFYSCLAMSLLYQEEIHVVLMHFLDISHVHYRIS